MRAVIGATGPASVDGVRIDPGVPVNASPLRDGVILDFSAADERPSGGPRRGPALRVLSGPDAGRTLLLERGRKLRVGRSGDVHLALSDTDVSRLHCEVQWDGGRLHVTDRDSKNGTVMSHEGRFSGRPRLTPDVSVDLPHGEQFQIGGTRLAVDFATAGVAPSPDGQGGLLVNRAPRTRAKFEAPTVDFPTPPSSHVPQRSPLLLMAGLPLVLSVVSAVVWRQPSYLVFGLLSPVMAVGMWWNSRRVAKQADAENFGDYERRLAEAQVAVHAAVDDEDAYLRRQWPDPAVVLRWADPADPGLWQRRAGDDDWLRFTLGRSTRPASVRLRRPESTGKWQLPRLVSAPVGAELAACGAIGVAGAAADTQGVLDWLLVQAAVLHGPDELRIAVLSPESRILLWTRWLPHLKDLAGGVHAAWTSEGLNAALDPLTELLQTRLESRRPGVVPADVLVVLMGVGKLARRNDVSNLLQQGPSIGLRFLCVDESVSLLPRQCGAVLTVASSGDRLSVAQGDPGAVTADRVDAAAAERLARVLAPLRVVGSGSAAAAIPDVVRLSEIVSAFHPAAVLKAWESAPERTDVPIGADLSGTATIDLVKDGPHGVIVGTTGAGKSEFVTTLVASLAAASTPARLNFLFVDFKGNATFHNLARLPHAVGTVTNLDGALSRFFASLQAELLRRQRMFDEAGVSDFGTYGRLADREGREPMARLVVVVDEFAELKQSLPTAVDDLVGIARVGRSLGVHLLLATQDEADVTSHIKHNSELKVALRVSRSVSDMLLGSPLAGEITKRQRGRAVLRQSDELRTVQTAWSGAPSGSAQTVALRAFPLQEGDVHLPEPSRQQATGHRTELDDLIDAVAEAAAAAAIEVPHKPWLPPLPELLTRERCLPVPFALNLGLRDVPADQRQVPFAPRLGGGHLLLIGAPQSGRTSALRAIACGLIADTSPDALQVHVITAGHGLGELAELPHSGVVADAGDAWRVERLLSRLGDEVRSRRETLSAAGVGTLDELRERDPGAPPHLVLLVDGVDVVNERETSAPLLQQLLEDGSAVGLTVCVTSTGTKLRARFAGLFEHRLSFRRADNDCLGTLGFPHRADVTKLPPGRALLRNDSTVVQVPLLTGNPSGTAQRTALAEEVARAAKRWPAPRRTPLRVDRIPAALPLSRAAAYGRRPAGRPALLGVGGDELTARWANFDTDHVVAIVGPQRSGRTTALCATALSAAANGLRVALIAARPGAAYAALERAGIFVGDNEAVPAAMAQGLDALFVDDADRLGAPEPLPFGRPGLPALVATCRADRLATYGRSLAQALTTAEVGVVLRPGRGEVLGIEFPRPAFDLPVGCGYFVSHGEAALGRIAEPEAVTR
ncbi:FtsK/SpoIIIE domain-containing protein [Amycolatopsis sp. NPDC004169]|uniref:FtsK/SpoIIIE domain-containing protein n=1 Tax=Amycolatopsis sp. NPDC004169 TaxID=3154453 RepID=UPI0033A23F25